MTRNHQFFKFLFQKIAQVALVAILWQSIFSSHQCNQVLGIKIFGFDFSSLSSLRFPQPRPSYQHRPTYQQIPEPPPPQIDSLQNSPDYPYRQPEYNSVYSDQFVPHQQTKQDIYNSGVEEPQPAYVENKPFGICPKTHPFAYSDGEYCCKHDQNYHGHQISITSRNCKNNDFTSCDWQPCKNFGNYQYDYGNPDLPSYDTQEYTDQIYRQDVQELPPSPVYIPSQHADSTYTTAPSSIINNQFHTINSNINNENQYPTSYNQGRVEYSDYQELEIITAPTVKSKASVYGGQHTFDVKVGAGFHTSTR